jgi:hypothetical protein
VRLEGLGKLGEKKKANDTIFNLTHNIPFHFITHNTTIKLSKAHMMDDTYSKNVDSFNAYNISFQHLKSRYPTMDLAVYEKVILKCGSEIKRGIWKITSAELLTKQAMRKNYETRIASKVHSCTACDLHIYRQQWGTKPLVSPRTLH